MGSAGAVSSVGGDGPEAGVGLVIHPASLSSTSALLSSIVSLLMEGMEDTLEAPERAALEALLVQTKHMFDMTRVLKTELPADAALDRL